MILIQHEVIVYGEDEKAAKSSLLRSAFAKDRTNLQCVYIQELPLPKDEKNVVFENWRKAPGA
ncbi:Uncharacterised protein [uncultured archaeon]|nr:Uncharacterised protein [uncultured archaeon]